MSNIQALRARYASETPPGAAQANAVIDSLLSHRTIRGFLPQKLPAGTLETLVAAAQSAATSSNLQTWSVLAVEDPARIARLSDFAGGQKFIRTTPLFLVWLAWDFSIVSTLPLVSELAPQARATLLALNVAAMAVARLVSSLTAVRLWAAGGLAFNTSVSVVSVVLALVILAWGVRDSE